jgi:hypothetical protein
MIFCPRKQEGICGSLGFRKKISRVRQICHKKKIAVDKKRKARQIKASKHQGWYKSDCYKPKHRRRRRRRRRHL